MIKQLSADVEKLKKTNKPDCREVTAHRTFMETATTPTAASTATPTTKRTTSVRGENATPTT